MTITLHNIARSAAVATCLGGMLSVYGQTPASTTTAPGTAYFQDATVVGTTNSISITRLPVTAGGKTYYWDLVLPFDVDTYGNVSTASLTAQKSPTLISSAFEAGTYHSPSTILAGKGIIVVTGPGVWNGVYTEWTISAGPGADVCTYPNSGAYYVSSLTGNPIYLRLKKAGITSTAWSYGIGDSPCHENYAWANNGIIGVSQVGKTLTIASFTSSYYGTDQSTPVDQITYTLQ